MRPAPEHSNNPADLLRISAGWLATALVQDLTGPVAALRANAQAARRLLARDCPDSSALAAILADLLEDADRLDGLASVLREPSGVQAPRSRLQPEREIAATVALLSYPVQPLVVEGDERAPRITGRPGQIGAAVLHLLLGRPSGGNRIIRAHRPRPASLVVQILGNGPATPPASLHAAAAAAAVASLCGSVDFDAADGPRFEIPLEL